MSRLDRSALMPNLTLASGPITPADRLSVDLVNPADAPPVILIRWPGAPSVTDQRRLAEMARAVTAILAEAVARLAALKAGEQ